MKKLLAGAGSFLAALFLTVAAGHAQSVATFDPTPVGKTASKTVSITVPSGAFTITTAAIADGFKDFALKSTTCVGATANATCSAEIVFHPILPGGRTAPLVLTDSGGIKRPRVARLRPR